MRRVTRFGGSVILMAALLVTPGVASAQSDPGSATLMEQIGRLGATVAHRLGAALRALTGDEAAAVGLQEGDYRWSGRVRAGDLVEVKGVNGSIVAMAAEGREVVVVARKRAHDDDPDEVRIEVIEHEKGVTLCAVYPDRDGENHCGVGDEGRNRVQNNDVQVDFEVRVPAGVRFSGRNVNGGIEAVGLDGDVTVATVNGDVEVATRGFAEASTVNGSIRAVLGSDPPREGLDFKTVNGSIEVDVPDDINADIDARWVNGGLDTDLPMRVVGRISRRRAQGVLGNGGPTLSLSTVNGSIRVR